MAIYRGEAFIAFIDLLGFSTRLRESWGESDDALETLLKIKSRFQTYTPSQFVVVDRQSDRQSPTKTTEMSLFSDSILVLCKVQSSEDILEFNAAAFATLTTIGDVMKCVAAFGFGVRGAVEFGNIWWDGNEVIGPAFIDAYALEAKLHSARVAIGAELLQRWGQRQSSQHIAELLYECGDGLMAVRPIAGPEDRDPRKTFKGLRAAAPIHFQPRYDELLANLDSPGPTRWEPAKFTASATATRNKAGAQS